MTETGLRLGTPHYMSPEQATAEKEITARSDVYSLASVLYEMLAGQPPHLGGSAQQIIMKIIAEPVEPVTRYRKSVPPNVAAALAKALEKLPADRFESAKAFAEALTNPAFTTMNAAATAAATTTVRGWLRNPLSWAAMAVAVAGLAGLARVTTRPLPDPPMRTVEIVPPDFGVTDPVVQEISRDGSLVVLGGRGGKPVLLSLEDFRVQDTLDGVGGATVSFSRNGTRIAGRSGGFRLMSWPLAGGPGVPLSDSALNVNQTSAWDEEDRVWFITRGDRWLARVPGNGGSVDQLMPLDTAWIWRISHIMAGGRLAFGDRASKGLASGLVELVAYDLAGDTVRVLGNGENPQVVGDEYLMYDVPNEDGSTAGNTIMVSRFDPRSGSLIGRRVPLMNGVSTRWAVSREGTFAYVDLSASTPYRVGLVSPGGDFRELQNLNSTMSWLHGVVSPQGDRLALTGRPRTNSVSGSNSEIWVYTLPDGPAQKLAWGGEDVARDYPVWSHDGKRIFFAHNQGEQASIYSVSADRSGRETPIFGRLGSIWEGQARFAVALDDRTIVQRNRRDLLRYLPGDTIGEPLVPRGNGDRPSISPDGDWIAYDSDENGPRMVYVQSLTEQGRSYQISIEQGLYPIWSRSGKKLFYRSGGSMTEALLDLGSPSIVTKRNVLPIDPSDEYQLYVTDVLPGDSVFVATAIPTGQARVMVKFNFLTELKKQLAGLPH